MKKRKGKQLIAFLLSIFSVIIMLPEPAKAQAYWPEGPQIATPNAIIMEVNTATVLYEKNAHEKKYPASITKIMTTWLTLENCELDEIVTFSEDAVFKNEGNTSQISRDVGEEMTVEECLYAVMLFSANECAYAVAEHVGQKLGGNYQTFIDLMNKRAEELGCTDTHFNNSNGLPDENHWTSAYDMALIARAAYKNENFRTIAGTKKYVIPSTNKHSEETPLVNHHEMLYSYKSGAYLYEYCTGGKTGYTTVANSTLVTYAEKDGLTLVCVVMNTKSPNHYLDTTTLMDYYFNNFQRYNLSEESSKILKEKEKDYGILNDAEPFLQVDTDAYIILPKSADLSDVQYQIAKTGEKENSIGVLQLEYAEHSVGSADIIVSNSEIESFFKGNSRVQEEKENVILVRPVHFAYILIILLVLIGIVIGIRKFRENIYVYRHSRKMKKLEKQRFAEIKPKKWRKKDRLFH